MPTVSGFKTRVVLEIFERAAGKQIEQITKASMAVTERVVALQEWAADNNAAITVGEQEFVSRRVPNA